MEKMEVCVSDISSECLVTNLVNELSSGLEIPFLLSEDVTVVDKQENVSPWDDTFYKESPKEDWTDEVFFKYLDNSESGIHVKDEVEDDLHNYFIKNDIEQSHYTNGFSENGSVCGSGSGSGSGSECSSTEIWVTKNELDTPPITPPDERVSPESVFQLQSDEMKFIPICLDGDISSLKTNFSSMSKKVRIQPKPVSTTLNIFDSQLQNAPTVMCDVFSGIKSKTTKSDKNELSESTIFFNPNEGKKSVLLKKDLELLQAKRKQERMIRNRESAYLSRKRKKEHVAHLEKQVQDLLTENNQLRLENCNLRQKLAKYEDVERYPVKSKSRNIFADSPRKTTALLALMLTVCLNIGSLSSLINEKKMTEGDNEIVSEYIAPVYSKETRHTRSLLWAGPEFEGVNSTFANLNKTSCPVFINQTESIRLESELRKWIGGEDDYSKPSKKNISKISQYFYVGEKPPRPKNMSKRKMRNRIRNSFNRRGSLEMDMYQMKPKPFSFDTLFEAIHRRDDTFYLVSFSGDHLLLPALSHNRTSRPKMSLMLPAFLSNGTGFVSDHVEMMQIDCEVTNTQLLSVNENDIPSHMRPYSNSTTRSKSANETKAEKFEEFFVNDIAKTLLPTKKLHFEAESIDSSKTRDTSNQTLSLAQKSTSNLTKSNDFKVIKFQHAPYNFNSSNKKNLDGKIIKTQRLYDDKMPGDLVSNVLSGNAYKRSTVGFMPTNGKNLLKMLMVNPNIPNMKPDELSSAKLSGKSLKNATKFFFH